jgi:uncharacterized protein (TIGR02646 family)
MIQITKPAAPKKLLTDGKTETEKNKRLYENGVIDFDIKKNIYGHQTVKNALTTAQYQKCCFCERKTEIGDIEHLRPKNAYQQKEGKSLSKPGYYWLAYEWENLFFCCEKCNRSYKRNLFPLADESKRAKSHLDHINREEPLFINPETENPEEFIEFIGIHPQAINNNARAKTTIKRTGIDRPFLDERRLTTYKAMKVIYMLINSPNIDQATKNELQQLLNEATQNSAEFASMIRCAVKDKFRF